MMRLFIIIFCLLFINNPTYAGNKFLQRYCLDCHNNKKHKGGINLQKFTHEDLYAAIEQLELGEMPPRKYKRKPTQKETAYFINSVKKYLQKQKPVTKVHYKWMMKSEHERALKNFFGLDVESSLPERSDNGFHMPDSKYDSDSITPEYLEKIYKLNNFVLDQIYLEKHKFNESYSIPKEKITSRNGGSAYCNILENGKAHCKIGGPRLAWNAPYGGDYKLSFYFEPIDFKFEGQGTLNIYRTGIKSKLPQTAQRLEFTVKLKHGNEIAINMKSENNKITSQVKDKNFRKRLEKSGFYLSNFKIEGPISFNYDPWNKLFKYSKSKVRDNLQVWLNKLHPHNQDLDLFYGIYNDYLSKLNDVDLAYKETLRAILNDYRFTLIDDFSETKVSQIHRLHNQIKGSPAPVELLDKKYDSLVDSLTSDKLEFFAASFASNWLAVKKIDETFFAKGTTSLYKHEYVKLINLFMADLFNENQPIRSLVKNDYITTNKGFHKWLPDIKKASSEESNKPMKIKAPESRRYGVLSHPALHAAISNGDLNPNPIIRGAWVYKQFFGKHPPEPPPNVEGVNPNLQGITDFREIIEKHSENQACYSCHKKFDGLGFALEHYDSSGKFRPFITKDVLVKKFSNEKEARKQLQNYSEDHYVHHSKLLKKERIRDRDASGEFFGGKINSLKDLSHYLVGEGYPDFKLAVIKRLYEQLLTRSLTVNEKTYIKNNYQSFDDNLKTLLTQILKSDLFRFNKIK